MCVCVCVCVCVFVVCGVLWVCVVGVQAVTSDRKPLSFALSLVPQTTKVRVWRRRLHEWDNPRDEDEIDIFEGVASLSFWLQCVPCS